MSPTESRRFLSPPTRSPIPPEGRPGRESTERTDRSPTPSGATRSPLTTARPAPLVRAAVHSVVTSAVRGAVLGAAAWRTVRAGTAGAVRAVRQSVRPAGALVLATAVLGLGLGLAFGWVEWSVAGAIALVLVILASPFLFGARDYEVGLTLAHDRVMAGDAVVGGVAVRNVGAAVALPGRIDVPIGAGLVEFGVPLLRPGRGVRRPLEIPPQRRGIVRVGPAVTVRGDPVGLLRREHAFDDVHDLYVHPRTVALPSTSAGLIRDLDGQVTRRLVDADISFHAIREYVPGDARRQIHWPSTAKTGRLMVRQYEESRRSRMAVVLSVDGADWADADEFELGVSAAASLALRAVRDARDLDVVVGTELSPMVPRVVRGRVQGIRRLPSTAARPMLDAFSGIHRLPGSARLEEVCRLTAEAGDRLSVAVVVTGSRTGLTRLRQATFAFPVDTVVVAVTCDELARPRLRPVGAMTAMTIGTLDDLAGLLGRGAAS